MIDYLTKIGVSKKDRMSLVYRSIQRDLLKSFKDKCPAAIGCMESHFLGKLYSKVWKHKDKVENWTNNNAESMNNVIKTTTDFKLKKLPDLIDLLHKSVCSQFLDFQKSFTGIGRFKLEQSFKKYQLLPYDWMQLNEQEKKNHLLKSLIKKRSATKVPKAAQTVTSTDKQFVTVMPSSNVGKKKGQRKRSRSERTVHK